MNLPDEKNLVEEAKTNTESFGKLYDYYFPKVYAFIVSKIQHADDAEDLTSEVFMKILENLPRFEWRGLPFGAWIFKIARNVLNDFYTKNSKHKTTDLDQAYGISESEEKVSPYLKAARKELEAKVNEIFKDLPDRELQVIQLKFFSGLSNREITRMLGLSETNVGIIIYRTLRKIKPDLQYFHNYF
jgi:RNA polymerase sigma-70 factor (ECF subfamily)